MAIEWMTSAASPAQTPEPSPEVAGSDPFVPSPYASPLLGFIARLAPGERYATYPFGRYTRAAIQECPEEILCAQGRKLVGHIDDHAEISEFHGRPVAPLCTAVQTWPLDAILVTRDTHDLKLTRNIELLQSQGLLKPAVRIIRHPLPTVEAAAAHLAAYHPTCEYEPAFVQACRSSDRTLRNESLIVATMDAEMFPYANRSSRALYGRIMREMSESLAEVGFAASLCVQLHDTPGTCGATPEAVVEAVLEVFGEQAVELHGLDHTMPLEGYEVEWFQRGIDELRTRYGVSCRYWAPPGWNLHWRSLRALQSVPAIQAVRGVWTGVNCRQSEPVQTFRFPYRVGHLLHLPYSYVDWMFMDLWSQPCDESAIIPMHERLAKFAAASPCIIENVIHPYRLVSEDWPRRLKVLRESLKCYTSRNVRITTAREAIELSLHGMETSREL